MQPQVNITHYSKAAFLNRRPAASIIRVARGSPEFVILVF